jgi:hypothetical protein
MSSRRIGEFVPSLTEAAIQVLMSGIRIVSARIVLSCLVGALDGFCVLEKYDYSSLLRISQWGVITFDICSMRGLKFDCPGSDNEREKDSFEEIGFCYEPCVMVDQHIFIHSLSFYVSGYDLLGVSRNHSS